MTEYDVLVVGSGGGAMAGAAIAAKHGLSVLVLEKTAWLGGTSAYSGGACWLPGTEIQQRNALPDSTDGAREYLNAIVPDADPARIETFLAASPQLVDELEADELFAWEWIPFSEYFDAPGRVPFGRSIQPSSIKRAELPAEATDNLRPPVEMDRMGAERGRNTLSGGQALIARLSAIVLRDGGQIRTNAAVTGLIVEDGRVVGVRVGEEEIRARGVLIAAGGFEGSPALREDHHTPGATEWSMAPKGANTGDWIGFADEVDADLDWTGEGWFCPGLLQPDGSGSFTLGFRSGVMLDANGKRYANECLPYDRFGREMAKSADRVPSWFIFDSKDGGQLPGIAIPEGDPKAHFEAGTWVKADTLAELARAIGLPEAEVVASVERFNGYCATGTDEEFGRGSDEYDGFFCGGTGPNKALTPIDQAPYLAAKFVLSDLGTKGGFVTDTAGRVLNKSGAVIPGLYASSNSAAALFRSVYPGPGAPLGAAMVYAYLAVGNVEEMLA
jgi:3-oxosteroid 1-dehydrogenase